MVLLNLFEGFYRLNTGVPGTLQGVSGSLPCHVCYPAPGPLNLVSPVESMSKSPVPALWYLPRIPVPACMRILLFCVTSSLNSLIFSYAVVFRNYFRLFSGTGFIPPEALFFLNNFFVVQFLFIYLFIFGCPGSSLLCAGFLQLRQPGATLQLPGAGFLLQWFLLWSRGSSEALSVIKAHRLGCPSACRLFPDQGSNLGLPALMGRFLTTVPTGKSTLSNRLCVRELVLQLIS